MESAVFPPNPNRNLDDTLKSEPAGANQAAGLTAYLDSDGQTACAACHELPTGTDGRVIQAATLQEAQQMKVPQLRNMYRRLGMREGPGESKSGFGYTHDGALPNLLAFLTQPVFNPWPDETKDDIVEFLLAFPTGMAPAVGYQVTVDATNVEDPAVQADVLLLQEQAEAGKLDLVAKGTFDEVPRGLLYNPDTNRYEADAEDLGPFTVLELRDQVLAGTAVLTLTGTRRAADAGSASTATSTDEATRPMGCARDRPRPSGAPVPCCWTATVSRASAPATSRSSRPVHRRRAAVTCSSTADRGRTRYAAGGSNRTPTASPTSSCRCPTWPRSSA